MKAYPGAVCSCDIGPQWRHGVAGMYHRTHCPMSFAKQRTDAPKDIEIMGGPFDVMRLALKEHHVGGGLTFKRTEDGNVILRMWIQKYDGWHFHSLTGRPLTSEEWSTVVSVIGA